jgi:hypothetical protein
MIRFSTLQLMDEQKCYDYLVEILHPDGLCCPACERPVEQSKVHRHDRAPVLYFRCSCGRIYNAFAGTLWQGTHHSCCVIVRILQGFAQGIPTLHLAQELGVDRKHLLERRHRIQELAAQACRREPLADAVVEADEMYQNAGEKGRLHPDPEDPPRRRANQARGHGTWETDRPPVLGIVGRESGQILLLLKKTAQDGILSPASWRRREREPLSIPTNGAPTSICPRRSANMSPFAIRRASVSGHAMMMETESVRFTSTPTKGCGQDSAIFFAPSAA